MLVSSISPSMVTYRTMMLGRPVDRDYLINILDKVILPAVGLGPVQSSAAASAAPLSTR
jgi:hypothetical protein